MCLQFVSEGAEERTKAKKIDFTLLFEHISICLLSLIFNCMA